MTHTLSSLEPPHRFLIAKILPRLPYANKEPEGDRAIEHGQGSAIAEPDDPSVCPPSGPSPPPPPPPDVVGAPDELQARLEVEEQVLPVVPPPPPPPPDAVPRAARGERVKEVWGGKHAISEICPKDERIGWGIICGRHADVNNNLECKMQITFGKQNKYDDETCIRELKSWVLEGYMLPTSFPDARVLDTF